jgi:hypothetical protein
MLVGGSNKEKLLRDIHPTFLSFSNIEIEFSHVMRTRAKPRFFSKNWAE